MAGMGEDMILNWIYLLLAIACEVTGTVMMKVSDGFTRMIPSILVAVFYILTLPFFTLALKKIDVGVAYAVWSAPEKIEFINEIPVKAYVRSIGNYPYHWHDALEIIQVLKGSVNIGMGTEDHLLSEGSIAVINSGELHRIEKNVQDNLILFVQIDDCFYKSVLPDSEYSFIYCCSTYHEAEAPEKYDKLKEYLARLVEAINEQSRKAGKKNIESIQTGLLSHLTDNFNYLRWGPGTAAFEEKQVKRLKQMAELINNSQSDNPGLKDLAAEVDLSLYHLSHDIKDKFGYTFKELLFYSRIEQAAKLLLSTNERIIDIAMECGFSDSKYLIKHFRQNYKHTPSKFREMYRADDKTLASQAQYNDYPLSEAIKCIGSQKATTE